MTTMQMKLELIPVPVTDVDRAKAFYTEQIGFHADFDQQVSDELRFVQLTPPGKSAQILRTPTKMMEVPRVEYEQLTDRRESERSADVRARVLAARERQARRFVATPRITCNADMGPAEVRQFCAVEPAAEPLLKAAMQRLQLSARAFHRILKLARTIADLAGSETIAAPHIAEALQYRTRIQTS